MRVSVFTEKVVGRISDALDERVAIAGNMIRNDVVARLGGKRSGRMYTVPGTKSTKRRRGGKKYRASKAGEAPAVRTGDLRRSIKVAHHRTARTARAEVGSDLVYAVFLEKGTRRLEARPFLRPALDTQASAIRDLFSKPIM
jgi:hypothetical protein